MPPPTERVGVERNRRLRRAGCALGAFWSLADNLVPGDANVGDSNDGLDLFVRDRQTGLSAPRLSVDNVAVIEGPAGTVHNALFTVSLSPKPSSLQTIISVNYWTD